MRQGLWAGTWLWRSSATSEFMICCLVFCLLICPIIYMWLHHLFSVTVRSPSFYLNKPLTFHLYLLSLTLFNEGETLVLHPTPHQGLLKLYVLFCLRIWLKLFPLFGTVISRNFLYEPMSPFSPPSIWKFTCNFQVTVDHKALGWLWSFANTLFTGFHRNSAIIFYGTYVVASWILVFRLQL